MTVERDISLAPGCFGSPIIFKQDGPICSLCAFAAQCAPRAMARRQALQTHFGITLRVAQAPLPSSAEEVEVEIHKPPMVTKKVDALLDRLERAKIAVTSKLAAGENPFVKKPGFLRIACHLLLHMPGGVNREALCFAFMKQLHWTHGTAAAHALQAIQTLTALGAVVTDPNSGLVTLRKETNE